MNQKAILMILDGWGIAQNPEVSAIDQANTPFIDSLYSNYGHATLRTDGMNVGLPDGQMGNSEVGHMNLGAGRVVYQDLAKINKAVAEDSLKEEAVLQRAFEYAKESEKPIHFLGLLSNGGVHSHIDHLKGLIQTAADAGVGESYVHAFTDGRDVDPKSGAGFVSDLLEFLDDKPCALASIIGRYYAMDRDKRWERVKEAYDLLVNGIGEVKTDAVAALEESYAAGTTDEFIKPITLSAEGDRPIAKIQQGDVIIFFNFRTDRGRELTQVLSQQAFPEYDMQPLDLYYVTLTNYDETFKKVHVVYDKDNIESTLGEVLSKAGKKQIRIAETEKYPHVTFFFNGGRETPFDGEERILCPSPKVATYDLQPEMSAPEIRDAIVNELHNGEADFVCLNFANPDMVGHTGDMAAAIKACETVDSCARDVITAGLENGYSTIVIADHGNCDIMINPDGSPNTAHTTNPVPLILVDPDRKQISSGVLGDIAPTLLEIIGVPAPDAMTGKSLL